MSELLCIWMCVRWTVVRLNVTNESQFFSMLPCLHVYWLRWQINGRHRLVLWLVLFRLAQLHKLICCVNSAWICLLLLFCHQLFVFKLHCTTYHGRTVRKTSARWFISLAEIGFVDEMSYICRILYTVLSYNWQCNPIWEAWNWEIGVVIEVFQLFHLLKTLALDSSVPFVN